MCAYYDAPVSFANNSVLKGKVNLGQGAASLLPFEKLDRHSNYSSW
jgi:hypothetical protein